MSPDRPQTPVVPDQVGGPRFEVGTSGRLRLLDDPFDLRRADPAIAEVHPEVIRAAHDLVQRLRPSENAHPALFSAAKDFLDAINCPLDDVRFRVLAIRGIRLQNLHDAQTAAAGGLEPALEPSQHSALMDVLRLHGPFVLASREGRELLEAAAAYQRSRDDDVAYRERALRLTRSMTEKSGLAEPETVRLLGEINEQLAKGRMPERAGVLADATNRNWLSLVGLAALNEVIKNSIGASKAAQTLSSAGASVIDAAAGGAKAFGVASIGFLQAHSADLAALALLAPPVFGWLPLLIDWLKSKSAIGEMPDQTIEGPPPAEPTVPVDARSLPDLAIFRDPLPDGTEGPEMVVIPACPGGFLMGSPESEPERFADEAQRGIAMPHRFALGRYAVTFDEYDAFCKADGRKLPGDEGWGRGPMPAINVSWKNAQDYCRWLSEMTGAEYRLPSEAEWEYACRGDRSGGNATPFSPEVARTGRGAFLTSAEANFRGTTTYNGSPKGSFRRRTVSVDHRKFRPNGFGLWQMHGNVWEWCADAWREGSLPTTQEAMDGPADARRVVRGGSWGVSPRNLRSAARGRLGPVHWNYSVGFRAARTL